MNQQQQNLSDESSEFNQSAINYFSSKNGGPCYNGRGNGGAEAYQKQIDDHIHNMHLGRAINQQWNKQTDDYADYHEPQGN